MFGLLHEALALEYNVEDLELSKALQLKLRAGELGKVGAGCLFTLLS